MFKNEYKNKFGSTYSSQVFDKAQKANNWSLCYSLLYALSKNGMKYATAKTGPSSVINTTSLGCSCSISAKPADETGSLKITFKQLVIRIDVATYTDKKWAYIDRIVVLNMTGNVLGTLFAYNKSYDRNTTPVKDKGKKYPEYGPKCVDFTGWANNPETDEDKFRVQTATFKDASANYDICAMHYWAGDTYAGSISVFKAKDYFSSRYKYGFIMQRIAGADTVYGFADGSTAALQTVYEDAGTFSTKVARAALLCTDNFVGVIGGINGVYTISDGTNSVDSLFPDNRVSINGSVFQAITPGLFARTS